MTLSAPHAPTRWAAHAAAIDSLILWRSPWRSSPGRELADLIRALAEKGPGDDLPAKHAAAFRALLDWSEKKPEIKGDIWRAFLIDSLLTDENPFTIAAERRRRAQGPIPEPAVQAALFDLALLEQLYRLDGRSFSEGVADQSGMAVPSWTQDSGGTDEPAFPWLAGPWPQRWQAVAETVAARGCGAFARSFALRCSPGAGGLTVEPILSPDPIRLENLYGYRRERQVVVENTERLVKGLPAQNLLLYGERGTGKSATIKALAHKFGPNGLRLIEVPRSCYSRLRDLMSELGRRGLFFILFLDELSFHEDETEYRDLKGVLEGGVAVRPPNVLLYATSNRRHLVRELHTDRSWGRSASGSTPGGPGGEEVHAQDTMEEKLSLADRFGRTIIFASPDQEAFLTIVEGIAAERGIKIDPDELRRRALTWARWHNGRSGRSARQFVDDLEAELAQSFSSSTTAENSGRAQVAKTGNHRSPSE